MKKLTSLFVFVMLVVPFVKTLPQETTNNTGALAQIYSELAHGYSVQGKEMSKEEEKLLKTIPAEIKTKLEEVKKLNKNKYYELLRIFPYGVASFNGPFEGLIGSQPDLIKQKELEVYVELLSLKYKNSDASVQSKLKSDLLAKLSELFEIREAQKEREVKKLEERLRDLKKSLQARKQNKNEIVQRRIQELLGDSKYLRWE